MSSDELDIESDYNARENLYKNNGDTDKIPQDTLNKVECYASKYDHLADELVYRKELTLYPIWQKHVTGTNCIVYEFENQCYQLADVIKKESSNLLNYDELMDKLHTVEI